jgi:hypothetical protein
MIHLALEQTDWYGFSSLNDYQFVSKEILFLLPLLYIYHYIQCLMDTVVSFLLYILLRLFYHLRENFIW